MSSTVSRPARSLWCGDRLLVTVQRPDGTSYETEVDRPFARVGQDPACEVVLEDEGSPRKGLYLHATPDGVYWMSIDPRGDHSSVVKGWLASGESLAVGSYRVSATVLGNDFACEDSSPHLGNGHSQGGASPQLRIASLSGKPKSEFRLARALTLAGRLFPCHLRLLHASVSKIHCALYWDGKSLWAIDLLSSKGTLVNGRPVVTGEIHPGDVLQIGKYLLSYATGPHRNGRPYAPPSGSSEVIDDPVDHPLDISAPEALQTEGESELARWRQAAEERAAEATALRQQRLALQAETARAASQAAEVASALRAVEAERNASQATVALLQDELAEASASEAEALRLVSELADSRAALGELRQSLTAAREEGERLRSEAQQAETALQRRSEEHAALLGQTEGSRRELATQLEAEQSAAEDRRTELSQLRAALAGHEVSALQFVEAQEQIEGLQRQLEAAQAASAELAQQRTLADAIQARCTQIADERDEAGRRLQEAERRLDRLEQDRKRLESALAAAEEQSAAMNARSEAADARRTELEARLAAAALQAKALTEDCDRLQGEAQAQRAEVARLEGRLVAVPRLETELAESRATAAALGRQLESVTGQHAEQSGQFQETAHALRQSEQARQELLAELSAAQSAAVEARAALSAAPDAQAHQALLAELAAVRTSLVEAHAEAESKGRGGAAAQGKLDEVARLLEDERRRYVALESNWREAESARRELLRTSQAEAERWTQELQTHAAALAEQRSAAERRETEWGVERDGLWALVAEATREREASQAESERQRSQRAEQFRALESDRDGAVAAQAEVGRLLAAAEGNAAARERAIGSLEAALQAAHARCTTLEADSRAQQARRGEAETAEMRRLRDQLTLGEAQLAELERQWVAERGRQSDENARLEEQRKSLEAESADRIAQLEERVRRLQLRRSLAEAASRRVRTRREEPVGGAAASAEPEDAPSGEFAIDDSMGDAATAPAPAHRGEDSPGRLGRPRRDAESLTLAANSSPTSAGSDEAVDRLLEMYAAQSTSAAKRNLIRGTVGLAVLAGLTAAAYWAWPHVATLFGM